MVVVGGGTFTVVCESYVFVFVFIFSFCVGYLLCMYLHHFTLGHSKKYLLCCEYAACRCHQQQLCCSEFNSIPTLDVQRHWNNTPQLTTPSGITPVHAGNVMAESFHFPVAICRLVQLALSSSKESESFCYDVLYTDTVGLVAEVKLHYHPPASLVYFLYSEHWLFDGPNGPNATILQY